MSGFEVAGVVLGAVPIIIDGLKSCIDGLGRWHRSARELKSLLRTMETEQVRLKNAFEKLLIDIVPEAQLETMISDPLGPLWKDPRNSVKLNQRLSSPKEFENIVQELSEVMAEIKRKLNIGLDGKVQWAEVSGVKREYQRAKFTLQRADYAELLTKLRDGVSSLDSIVYKSVEMEPKRRKHFQGRLYRLLRDLSGSIYRALLSAVTCQCPSLHDIGLRLMPQPISANPYDDDEDIMKALKFSLALSSVSTGFGNESEGILWGRIKLWNLLSLSISISNHRHVSSHVTSGLRFSLPAPEPSDVSQHNVSNGANFAMTPTGEKPSQSIINLCQTLRRSRKQGAGECCGHILDGSSHLHRTYEVYPLDNPDEGGDWSLVSLRSVLAGDVGPTQSLLYGNKLRLAWVVASSVAQLRGTPWLASGPTHDDIFLAQQNGVLLFEDVFVIKRFPERAPPMRSCTTAAAVNRPTLMALGLLLIELFFGQVVEHVDFQSNGSTADQTSNTLSQYEARIRFLNMIQTLGSGNYYTAVRRCVMGEVYEEVNYEAQKDPFVTVLGLLEQDLEMAMA
ncbi:hypothetical protein B0T25DRAFT_265373 [Lasiosphaeria hispida]|uniref:DUF7580 domain-containing protein n=1 Tax=Lasiosphaeria hispida TaxID=260671 RepID=A0AAJ0MA42_9PEZI|nr:hypothetical protein B0T25DRAFT_265373 [Lasiosphaeria hispida]